MTTNSDIFASEMEICRGSQRRRQSRRHRRRKASWQCDSLMPSTSQANSIPKWKSEIKTFPVFDRDRKRFFFTGKADNSFNRKVSLPQFFIVFPGQSESRHYRIAACLFEAFAFDAHLCKAPEAVYLAQFSISCYTVSGPSPGTRSSSSFEALFILTGKKSGVAFRPYLLRVLVQRKKAVFRENLFPTRKNRICGEGNRPDKDDVRG
jgi:hypothetical protein